MIRFEQDPRAAIEQIIREDVRVDIYGELWGEDRAADAIMTYIDQLKYEIELLKAKLAERSWGGSVDRQGGSFDVSEQRDEFGRWR